jgi:hypothetical protein
LQLNYLAESERVSADDLIREVAAAR